MLVGAVMESVSSVNILYFCGYRDSPLTETVQASIKSGFLISLLQGISFDHWAKGQTTHQGRETARTRYSI